MMAYKGDTSQSFEGKHIICARPLKYWKLPTQLIIFPVFWVKILKNCPPSKLFLFTSLQKSDLQLQ